MEEENGTQPTGEETPEKTPQQKLDDLLTESRATNTALDKTWRKGLDDVLQAIKSYPSTRERALCVTKIQEAIMWLGMDLKEINNGVSPYTGSYDPNNPLVHPVADGLKM